MLFYIQRAYMHNWEPMGRCVMYLHIYGTIQNDLINFNKYIETIFGCTLRIGRLVDWSIFTTELTIVIDFATENQ